MKKGICSYVKENAASFDSKIKPNLFHFFFTMLQAGCSSLFITVSNVSYDCNNVSVWPFDASRLNI